MASSLPLPGVEHGARTVASIIEELAREESHSPWVSVPVDDKDISKGFKDITYGELDNAANRAALWLQRSLPSSSQPFQTFAYAGRKDIRYAILSLAAAKICKVVFLPSTYMITAEAQLHILSATRCTTYLRDDSVAETVDKLREYNTSLNVITIPELGEWLNSEPAEPIVFPKTWAEAKDDPWIIFHTSGTTGTPKPITYSQSMLAVADRAASIRGLPETHIHHYARRRWYCPLPLLHFVGTLMVLSMTSGVRTVVVLGPTHLPATPDVVKSVLQNTHVDGALLAPIQIDGLCHDPEGLKALRSLSYIHFAGAPLGTESGKKLSVHVHVVPSIGSTEAGGYFTKIRSANDSHDDWDYVEFQPEAGAVFEPRLDGLHELVFVKSPKATMQSIFQVYPEKDRFETSDLWTEHPTRKNHWKIVGRADDYVYFGHAGGLHATTLEPEIEKCELVQNALIGGHGQPRPVLIVELVASAQPKVQSDKGTLVAALQPYIDAVNEKCHESVRLSSEAVIFVEPDRPLLRTGKGSVARAQSLKQYQPEIENLFRR